MRIAVINQYRRLGGGIETYLDAVIPELVRLGHSVLLISERDEPGGRPRIASATVVEEVQLTWQGTDAALRQASDWRPDILFLQGFSDAVLESRFCRIAPVVAFSHVYSGACISGTRLHQWPGLMPCDKVFGPACLLHYLPRRCGGLSPVTMIRQYSQQQLRLETLKSARAVVVSTESVGNIFRRSGLSDSVHVIGLPVTGIEGGFSRRNWDGKETRLLFVGRLEPLKGVELLIRSLAGISGRVGGKVRLTLAGEGSQRSELEALVRAEASRESIAVAFEGWVEGLGRSNLFRDSHLLVVPSIWPEPFGLVGLEGGSTGLPSVAFDTGGVPEWLHEGRNGHLAPGKPPTHEGLADAVARCFTTSEHFQSLSEGAADEWRKHSLHAHMQRLIPILNAHSKSTSMPKNEKDGAIRS